MTSEKGTLTVSLVYVKPALRKGPEGKLIPTGECELHIAKVLCIDGVGEDEAKGVVAAWRRVNPDVRHEAVWEGPTRL
jgi:hypothetical protein